MVGGRVHTKDIFGPHLVKKMAAMKININLKKWLSQIGWIIINAIWLFSALKMKHRTRM